MSQVQWLVHAVGFGDSSGWRTLCGKSVSSLDPNRETGEQFLYPNYGAVPRGWLQGKLDDDWEDVNCVQCRAEYRRKLRAIR